MLKRNSVLFSLLLIFSLMLTPLLVMAQEEEMELEEYEDEDGAFSLSYPAGWAVSAEEEEGAILIANSEETLEAMMTEEDIEIAEGQFGMAIFFFPAELLGMMGLDVEMLASEDITPEEVAQALADMIMEMEGGEGEEGSPVFAEPMFLELDEESVVAVLPFTIEADNVEGAYFFYEVGDGVFALGTAAAYTGELADNEEAIGVVLASLEFNLSAEDLMSMYMGEMEVEATAEP